MTTNTSSPNTPDPHSTKKPSNPKKCRFQYDDRKYIDRGQLYVLQISVAILKQGLGELNHGKVGRPFGFSNACFAAASLLTLLNLRDMELSLLNLRDLDLLPNCQTFPQAASGHRC